MAHLTGEAIEGLGAQERLRACCSDRQATVLTIGTELCRRRDVLRIYRQICAEQVGVAA